MHGNHLQDYVVPISVGLYLIIWVSRGHFYQQFLVPHLNLASYISILHHLCSATVDRRVLTHYTNDPGVIK